MKLTPKFISALTVGRKPRPLVEWLVKRNGEGRSANFSKPQKNASAFLGASQANHETCTHIGEALLSIPRKTGTNKKASLLGFVTRLLTQVAKIHFCPLGRTATWQKRSF